MAKVGLAYNLFQPDYLQELPIDRIAELDSGKTIQAMADALKSGGHEVILLEADESFADKLKAAHPEIVFNIAEGMQEDSRESEVPAMCEFFGIPYTGSGILTLSICLNKAITNEVLSYNNILVPPSQVFQTRDDVLELNTEFPLIVKLLHEGSSMGLSEKSVVENEKALRSQVDFIISTYHEPVLVQKFIIGREFTVGILGNRNPFPLPITEVTFQDPYGIVTFNPDDEVLPVIERVRGEQFLKDFKSRIIPHQSACPAEVSPELAERINQTALKVFKVLECRDWCRVDFRLGTDDNLYVLELNPIAGIAPGDWLPNSAKVVNLNYDGFINKILDIALERIHEDQQLL
jgi:D-alanine-D-alanine ligase-like ATP-grasp enzyme